MKLNYSIFALFMWFSILGNAHAFCFDEAESEYRVSADLLKAIAIVESGNNPGAIGKLGAGEDIGLMQINSSWLGTLEKKGITREDLLNDPCVNVKVGAWILSDNFKRMGFSWNSVGAYNASCTVLKGDACINQRLKYVRKVWDAMSKKGAGEIIKESNKQEIVVLFENESRIESAFIGLPERAEDFKSIEEENFEYVAIR